MMQDKYGYLVEKRYDDFKNTLDHCGIFLINATDEEIEYHIFEEFDIDVRADLYDDVLEMFLFDGFIDENIKEKCLKLRNLFLCLEEKNRKLWNVSSVRSSELWRNILELSDEIKSLLYV